MNDPVFHKPRIFRETPGVKFHDISVPGSNGIDLVEHEGPSVSPPDRLGIKQWYMHKHQTDNNRVIKGARLFELFFSQWNHPHWYVFLTPEVGALEIPPGCYHRSVSGIKGSLLLNHAVRDELYDERKEFDPRAVWQAQFTTPQFYNVTPAQAYHFIDFGQLYL